MNGSRSNPPRPDDRSSLDALSRTIEGLEARIEGLMGTQARGPRQPVPSRQDDNRSGAVVNDPYSGSYGAAAASRDAVNEIRQRKTILDRSVQERTFAERPMPATVRDVRNPAPSYAATGREPARERVIPARLDENDTAMREIAKALIDLRQDLKQDISEGVQREMQGLRAEIRNIRALAEDREFATDMRQDMARLAASIEQLDGGNSTEARGLRAEFEELRAVMDNLAREESVQRIESHWSGVEAGLRNADTASLQDEIVSLAYRLDDIKAQLGSMSNNPTVAALEDKLLKVAGAMEQIGLRMQQPEDNTIREQFTGLDRRLDEISRAIAASGRSAPSATDPALVQRLESRLAGLADQIDTIGVAAANRPNPANELAARLDALTGRIEELSSERAANRLEERLDQLSFLVQKIQKPAAQPELTGFLTDISRKIDALDQGAVGDALASRLDNLSRRIEDLDTRQAQQKPAAPAFDDSAFLRLEGRLNNIALRLEESAVAAPDERVSLRGLEDQIAHLSTLISQPTWREEQQLPAEFDRRMASIEEYMASNDEYIIEAARQAAEAVVEAYSRNGVSAPGANAPSPLEMETLSALADDLRHLEEIGRNRDERTHQTFEALHDTLVQIATRLDSMDNRIGTVGEWPRAQEQAAPRRAAEVFSRPDGGDFDAANSVAPVRVELNEHAGVSHTRAEAGAVNAPAGDIRAKNARSFSPAAFAADAAMAMDTAPVQAVASEGVAKTGLLAGLSNRFRPSAKKAVKAAEVSAKREKIESAPSIDPVDVIPAGMPDGMEDELLEPGSGAPDVKKILERVRASQNSADAGGGDAGRIDYIAAARRAAQAAAQETSPVRGDDGSFSGKARDAVSGQDSAGSMLSRYRRPILMAVGAVLLAVMAMPLVKTLTGGESAPVPMAEPQVIAPQNNTSSSIQPQATPNESGAVTVPQDLVEEGEVAQDSAVDDDLTVSGTAGTTGQASIDHRTVGGAPMPLSPTGNAASPSTIVVPATIEPKSLADAATSGDRLALFEIGARFTEGRGVASDLSEASKWYALSAERGLAPAQYRLGNLYEKGTGVARDLDKARQLYLEAAAQGNASAMHNLAVLYASAPGATPDYKLAGEWFIRAADLGVKDSQFNLAILYARGNGVPQDLEESYKWFAVAATDGDEDAARKRDEVAKAMLPAQLESARAKVAAWKPLPLNEDANSVSLPDAWVGKAVNTASIDMSKAIRNVQAILNNNGFDAGQPDGKMGKKTVNAIKAFQKTVNQPQTGEIDDALVKELLARNKRAG